jgi:hypothetical protein
MRGELLPSVATHARLWSLKPEFEIETLVDDILPLKISRLGEGVHARIDHRHGRQVPLEVFPIAELQAPTVDARPEPELGVEGVQDEVVSIPVTPGRSAVCGARSCSLGYARSSPYRGVVVTVEQLVMTIVEIRTVMISLLGRHKSAHEAMHVFGSMEGDLFDVLVYHLAEAVDVRLDVLAIDLLHRRPLVLVLTFSLSVLDVGHISGAAPLVQSLLECRRSQWPLFEQTS